MANNEFADQTLTPGALEQLMSTLLLARRGDLTVRMAARGEGVTQDVVEGINGILEMHQRVNAELKRLHDAVQRGDLQERATLQDCEGDWDEPLQHANAIVTLFSRHCSELRRVLKAVTTGDFKRTMATGESTTHRAGDLLKTAEEINGLITHLDMVVNELTHVVAGVGLDGRLNGQAQITNASGSWGLLVGSLNAMTASLSEQVLDLTQTAREYARGNLEARASVVSRGDMQNLKEALNQTGERAQDLCGELVRVSQEWIQDGRTGGQVRLGEAAGDMRRAVDATNDMLKLFTEESQRVGTAALQLATGESVAAAFDGEVRGIFAETRRNLAEAARNAERVRGIITGLTTNQFPEIETGGGAADMALFQLGVRVKREWFGASRSGLLEARREAEDLREFATLALARTAATARAIVGALHVVQDGDRLQMVANLGGEVDPNDVPPVKLGEGLVGRTAQSGEPLALRNLDEHAVRIRTSLIEVIPRAVLLFPIQYESDTVAVIELGFIDDSLDSAQELMGYLAPDIADGVLEAMQRGGVRTGADSDERSRLLGEDLAIASARIERLTRELQTRDRTIRDLQQELDLLRDDATQGEATRAM